MLSQAATGETIGAEELGGADVHCRISGCTDHYAESEEEAMSIARRLVASLNSRERGRRTIAEMRDRDPGENKCVTEHMLLGTVTSKPVVPTTILQQRVGTRLLTIMHAVLYNCTAYRRKRSPKRNSLHNEVVCVYCTSLLALFP